MTVKIADLMSKRVITAQPHHTVEQLREMMNKNSILAVPIVGPDGEPMGIVTLSLVAVTVFLGLFRRLKPRLILKWHKRLGPVALLAGATHAVLVLLAH